MSYEEVKQILAERCSSTKHFTKKFYKEFLEAKAKAEKHWKDGTIDEVRYTINDNGTEIVLNHCYDNIYASNFYNRNSGAYCEFLSLMV